MNFNLTAEQQDFQSAVRRYAEGELRAGAVERAHANAYPWDVAKSMAKQGLLGITMAEEDGGAGGSLMDAVIAIETVALVCPRSADVVQAGNFGAIRVLAEYGSAWQKETYLKPLLAGEALIAVGMTEPGAGSAVTELTTKATKDGKGWRINGSKIFTTHGPHADVILAYVRFGPGTGGIGSVLIDTKAEGVKLGKRSSFMSDEEWAEMFFDNVYIDDNMVVLGEGGLLALGRYAFEEARAWALQRKQFGRLLCEFQGLQWKFADMRMKLDAAQLLLYRAACNADTGFPSATETAIAKAYCNQTGFDVANDALQVMGGMGYSRDSLVEYCVRRCRGWMIAGGSIEILKNRIAEGVFERTFSQRAS
jgi:alkylation response protein AidB-like acyl-CoA dehydrogenase